MDNSLASPRTRTMNMSKAGDRERFLRKDQAETRLIFAPKPDNFSSMFS